MRKLQYQREINASAANVWKALWEDENYRRWTAHFSPGSHYKTDRLAAGSKIQFLGPDGRGMDSEISKMETDRYMEFRHLGFVGNTADMPGAAAMNWDNALETYRLEQEGDKTRLTVEVDVHESYADHMNEHFIPALDELKQIAEELEASK